MSSLSENSFVDDEIVIGSPRTKLKKKFQLSILAPSSRHSFSGFSQCNDSSKETEFGIFYTPEDGTKTDSFIDHVAGILNQKTLPDESESSPSAQASSTNVEDALARLKLCLHDDSVETVEIGNDLVVISDDEIDGDFAKLQTTRFEDRYEGDIKEEPKSFIADNSLVFDDTLDDINRFLAGASDESLQEQVVDEQVETKASMKDEVQTQQLPIAQFLTPQPQIRNPELKYASQPSFKVPIAHHASRRRFFKSPPAFEHVVSPVSKYIHSQPAAAEKTPKVAPRQKFFRTPETLKKSDRFKTIQSPIGLYIKHSAKPVVSRRVRNLHEMHFFPESLFEDASDPDMDFLRTFEIPQAVYKPGSKMESVVVGVKLPANIKALVPDIDQLELVEHTGRTQLHPHSDDSIAFALENNSDLTLNFSQHEDADVSYLCRKPMY